VGAGGMLFLSLFSVTSFLDPLLDKKAKEKGGKLLVGGNRDGSFFGTIAIPFRSLFQIDCCHELQTPR